MEKIKGEEPWRNLRLFIFIIEWRTLMRRMQETERMVRCIAPSRERSLALTKEDVFIVWFSKTLQNWKALVSTSVSDGMYYEITHNGDKGETYLDAYKKWDNQCIVD